MADSGPGPQAGTAASGDLEELSRDSWIDAFKRTVKAPRPVPLLEVLALLAGGRRGGPTSPVGGLSGMSRASAPQSASRRSPSSS
jgi:hypothetical protein